MIFRSAFQMNKTPDFVWFSKVFQDVRGFCYGRGWMDEGGFGGKGSLLNWNRNNTNKY